MHLHFLHGTETGTAEFLCDDLVAAFSPEMTCSSTSLDDLTPLDLVGDRHYVFVVSTFGSGELPFTAQAFHRRLMQDTPDLSHVRFSVFGLGDSTFDSTFNHGSAQVMTAMLGCKAQLQGERFQFDASGADAPEDVAVSWLRGVLQATV